jgi:hypothetical protein
MPNPRQPARLEIDLDEPRIARGSVDSNSVRVTVRWRAPEATPPIIAALDDLPPPVDLVVLKRSDGDVELVPRSWQRLHIGRGPSLYEMARRTPSGLGPIPDVREAIEYAEHLLAAYHPNFRDYAAGDRADLIRRTLEHLNRVSESIENLQTYLEYAGPERKAVPPVANPTRDVSAALLNEVCGYSSLQVGEELGFRVPADAAIKGENQTVRRAIQRGRALLEQCFGREGWRARAERMGEMRRRWESLEGQPKRQFYTLLAEERGTTAEEEQHTAVEDGFDILLGEWISAWESEDFPSVMRIQRSDPRFDALSRL